MADQTRSTTPTRKHHQRAKNIVARSMPTSVSQLVAGWVPNIEHEVERGLRQVEKEARWKALCDAANLVGDLGLGDRELNGKIIDKILSLRRKVR